MMSEKIARAIACQKAGKYAEAKKIYKDLLNTNPKKRDILFNLGVVCRLSGEFKEAVLYFKRAYSIPPVPVQVIYELGMALAQSGCFDESLGVVRTELDRDRESFQLHFLLGNIYRMVGNYALAAVSFGNAIQCKPDYWEARFNLSSSLLEINRLEEAIVHLEYILENRPDFFMAYISLGNALIKIKKAENALLWLNKALQIRTDNVLVYVAIATAQIQMGLYDSALQSLQYALQLEPDSTNILNGIGNVYILKNEFEKAKEYYQRALMVKPENPEAHHNLGIIMREWNKLDEAIICYKNALRFDTDRILSMINLGECYQACGEIQESEKIFRLILQKDRENKSAFDNLLLSMNYNPAYTPMDLFDAHYQWGSSFKRVKRLYTNSVISGKVLRIGYVSPDYRNHPSAAFLEPILQNHNPKDFTVYCYSNTLQADNVTERFKKICSNWRDIYTLSDSETARLIAEDQIDILVDCAGHMDGNRLPVFALKPAPVQITGIGYPNTSGLETIDYRITDDIADPPGETVVYTEKLLYLKNGFCCYNPPMSAPEVIDLPAQKNGFLTFGSLHTPARLNRNVIKLWANVLKDVCGSRLLIFRNTLSPQIINRLMHWFLEYGIDDTRVEYCISIPSGGYLNIYSRIDILLDTFPWSGHTTACESLWMGVPVITLRGNRYAGRMVSSVLSRIGREDYIANDFNAYRDIAIKKSSDIPSLTEDRASLRNLMKNSLLCNGKEFTCELEARYREIWAKWCQEYAQ